MPNSVIEDFYAGMKEVFKNSDVEQITGIVKLPFECERCYSQEIFYGIYLDRFGRIDAFMCTECRAGSEIEGRKSVRVTMAIEKLFEDLEDQLLVEASGKVTAPCQGRPVRLRRRHKNT